MYSGLYEDRGGWGAVCTVGYRRMDREGGGVLPARGASEGLFIRRPLRQTKGVMEGKWVTNIM